MKGVRFYRLGKRVSGALYFYTALGTHSTVEAALAATEERGAEVFEQRDLGYGFTEAICVAQRV